MNLYSRDEITAFNQKIQELNKKLNDLAKDIKDLDVKINAESNDANLTDMKKVQMNKKLEKDEVTLQIVNIKKKISAAV